MKRKQVVTAIIQARMCSTRLPGKVMSEVCGYPMLWHVVHRVRQAKMIDKTIVAASRNSSDNVIEKFCARYSIECFRGHEEDVLDRFRQAAKYAESDAIVRITADCPLIDAQIIDAVISAYLSGEWDYATNTLYSTYPDGLDVEVFSRGALEKAWKEAKRAVEREHVTPYLRHSQKFRIYNIESKCDLGALRWSVDEPADLEFVRAVYRRLWHRDKGFGLSDVLKLLEADKNLGLLNMGIARNEGYYRSLTREPTLLPCKRELTRSYELKIRARQVIPSCTQTFSKGPSQFVQGVAPVFLKRGDGSHVWDVDENEYIDYPMALGPVILGHNYPAVTNAVKRRMEDGTTFSLSHPLETELAELLCEIIPCAEMVRFGKNGSDVTAGAVRLARAYSGRDIIACCGYHGWQDWYIGTTTRNTGVPKPVQGLTIPFEYNDIDSLKRIFSEHPGQVAGVIMEPVGVVGPTGNFLHDVRKLTEREGALLIFDEVLTGFRLALGGAQEYFGVVPDLACFGKAMANGYPISAVVGRRALMELFDEVFFSFTFGGEVLSLQAALSTIIEIRDKGVIPHIWEQGRKLKEGYNTMAKIFGIENYTSCVGFPPRSVVVFQDKTGMESVSLKSLFQQECLKRKVLFSGSQNMCYSHREEDIDYTLRVYATGLKLLSLAIREGDVMERLEGESVSFIFRRA